MPGSPTALGRPGARNSAPVRLAFRQENGVSTQKKADFAAQWLAYAIPCRRFADALADNCARLGADVVCYTFIAVDFHHLLLADLPAHSLVGLRLPWVEVAIRVDFSAQQPKPSFASHSRKCGGPAQASVPRAKSCYRACTSGTNLS